MVSQCTKGSDTQCIQEFGQGACCFYQKVEKANTNPSSDQQIAIGVYALAGYPTTAGASSFYCVNAVTVSQHANDPHNQYLDAETGIEYKAYCDNALTKLVSFGLGLVSLLALSY